MPVLLLFHGLLLLSLKVHAGSDGPDGNVGVTMGVSYQGAATTLDAAKRDYASRLGGMQHPVRVGLGGASFASSSYVDVAENDIKEREELKAEAIAKLAQDALRALIIEDQNRQLAEVQDEKRTALSMNEMAKARSLEEKEKFLTEKFKAENEQRRKEDAQREAALVQTRASRIMNNNANNLKASKMGNERNMAKGSSSAMLEDSSGMSKAEVAAGTERLVRVDHADPTSDDPETATPRRQQAQAASEKGLGLKTLGLEDSDEQRKVILFFGALLGGTLFVCCAGSYLFSGARRRSEHGQWDQLNESTGGSRSSPTELPDTDSASEDSSEKIAYLFNRVRTSLETLNSKKAAKRRSEQALKEKNERLRKQAAGEGGTAMGAGTASAPVIRGVLSEPHGGGPGAGTSHPHPQRPSGGNSVQTPVAHHHVRPPRNSSHPGSGAKAPDNGSAGDGGGSSSSGDA